MPFASAKQRSYLYSQHPEVARRWREESGPQRGLPERKRKTKGQRDRMIEQFVSKHRK